MSNKPFFTRRFGDGYMINVRCEIETVEEVLQSVRRFIPEATLREQRPRQLILHIKPNVLPISDLFSRMESARSESNMVTDIPNLVQF